MSIEYKHRAVVFCPVCENCCETNKDAELGLVVVCPGCNYKKASNEAIVFQSAASSQNSYRFLPKELAFDPTRPVVRSSCPSCQHPWARKVIKDAANPQGELGVDFICRSCKTFFSYRR